MGYVWVYMQKMELRYWWEYGDEKNNNDIVDTVGIQSADLEEKILF